MAHTAYFDPFVDWSIAVNEARFGAGDPARTFMPVFLEGCAAEINRAFAAHDIPVRIPPAPGEVCEISCAGQVIEPLCPVSVPNFVFPDAGQIAGFYYMKPKYLRQIAAIDSLRGYIKGAGLPVQIDPARKTRDFKLPPRTAQSDKPIVAVIDEGIAYLNARFRQTCKAKGSKQTRTRFLGLWQQSIAPVQEQNCPYVRFGRVLTEHDINRDLDRLGTETEFDVYRSRNEEIFGDRTHRSTEQSFSHGTAILDLAAGADPKDGADGPDILAVQLPPETLEDTSGTHLPVFLLMALDWLLSLAFAEGRSIIINVSLGFSAGTKTGEALLERQIRSRVQSFNAEMNDSKAAQVVFAFGNSYRERLAARFDLDQGLATGTVDWDVPPDDPTPSFLQIHRVDVPSVDLSQDIEVELTSPDGQRFTEIPAVQESSDLIEDGCLVGRVYHDVLDGTARISVALAPTSETQEGLRAESGKWTATVRRKTRDVAIVLQVQRDDTAAGFERGGRQSVLDHPNGYTLDDYTHEFEAPDGGPGLTRNGTNSAIMVEAGDGIYLAAAAEPDPNGAAGTIRPSFESAGSDHWSQRAEGAGPTYSVLTEAGFGAMGVLAAGTFSDTTVPVNGTSVAAAKITRDLSGFGPALTPVNSVPRSERIGELRMGGGGARPRHPEI